MRRIAAPLCFALALAACASTPPPASPSSSAGSFAAPQARLPAIPVEPPLGSNVYAIPSGDPAARHLPDVLPADFTPRPYVRLKTDPERRYRIVGRIPPHYDVEFGSDFVAYGRDDPACHAILRQHGMEPTPFLQVQIPLAVRRLTPDRYEATLVIDRLEDDACRWVYVTTRIRVIDRNLHPDSDVTPFPNEDVVGASHYHLPESAPHCARSAPKCREVWARAVASSSDAPVLIRCLVEPPKGRTPHAWLGCGDPLLGYKTKHLLKPDTGTITIDLYDIGIEQDPIDPASLPPELRRE